MIWCRGIILTFSFFAPFLVVFAFCPNVETYCKISYTVLNCRFLMAATAATPANTSSVLSLTINKRKYNLREGDFDPKMFGTALLFKMRQANLCMFFIFLRVHYRTLLEFLRSRGYTGTKLGLPMHLDAFPLTNTYIVSQPIHAQGAGKAVVEHVQSRFPVTDRQ